MRAREQPHAQQPHAQHLTKIAQFNDGVPMPGVKVRLRDGSSVVGLLQRRSDACLTLRVCDEVLPLTVAAADIASVAEVEESEVPAIVYEDCRDKVLGGVGIHTRRFAYACSDEKEVGAVVTNFGSDASLLEACMRRLGGMARFASTPPELIDQDGETVCPIVVCGDSLTTVCYVLGLEGIYLMAPGVRQASIMPDSLNRAKHLYAQQLKFKKEQHIGPTRALWRFRFAHLPPEHTELPFSWPAWAHNVIQTLTARKQLDRVHELEMPLRAYVEHMLHERAHAAGVDRRKRLRELDGAAALARVDACGAAIDSHHVSIRAAVHGQMASCGCDPVFNAVAMRTLQREAEDGDGDGSLVQPTREKLERAAAIERSMAAIAVAADQDARAGSGESCAPPPPHLHYVTPALSEQESRKMLDAFHGWYYNPTLQRDDAEVKRARLQHGPQTHGYYPHWISAYELSGEFVGYGEDLRTPLAADAAVPAAARNRMRVVGDMLKGRGAQGYKGLFSPPSEHHEFYSPKRQLVRTALDDKLLRAQPLRQEE